jgi:hypothetical protein
VAGACEKCTELNVGGFISRGFAQQASGRKETREFCKMFFESAVPWKRTAYRRKFGTFVNYRKERKYDIVFKLMGKRVIEEREWKEVQISTALLVFQSGISKP